MYSNNKNNSNDSTLFKDLECSYTLKLNFYDIQNRLET